MFEPKSRRCIYTNYYEVLKLYKFMPKDSRNFYSEMGVKWLSDRKDPSHTDKELTYLLGILGKKYDILDLACGFGRFSIPLAKKGYRVSGIDITPIFIEHAMKIADLEGVKAHFSVGDMRNIPYEDCSFDAVICMWNAFSEIVNSDDQIKVIREIYRVLRKEGSGLIEVRNHRSPNALIENYIDGVQAMPSFNHTRGTLKKIAIAAGIENYQVFLDQFGGRKRLFLKFSKI